MLQIYALNIVCNKNMNFTENSPDLSDVTDDLPKIVACICSIKKVAFLYF